MKKLFVVILLVCIVLFGAASYVMVKSNIKELVVCATNNEAYYIPSSVCEYYLVNHRISKEDIAYLESGSGIAFLFEISDADKRYYLVEKFLSKGADINRPSQIDGLPPLHAAIITNDPKMVSILLKNDADITKRDKVNNMSAHEFLQYLEKIQPSIDRGELENLLPANK